MTGQPRARRRPAGSDGHQASRARQRRAGTPPPGIAADYDRANALRDRLQNTIFNVAEAPTWIGRTAEVLVPEVGEGRQRVRARRRRRRRRRGRRSITTRLAEALSAAAQAKYTARDAAVLDVHVRRRHAVDRVRDRRGRPRRGRAAGAAPRRGAPRAAALALHAHRLSLHAAAAPADRPRARAGAGAAGAARPSPAGARAAAQPQTRVSPDGKTEAFIQNYNVYVRPVDAAAATPRRRRARRPPAPRQRPRRQPPRRCRGTVRRATPTRSTRSRGRRTRRRSPRSGAGPATAALVTYVQSSPADQLQPKIVDERLPEARRRRGPRPAGALRRRRRSRPCIVDNALFPNPYSNGAARVAQGQPRVHVRVQPARPPGLPRDRGRRGHRQGARASSTRPARRSSTTGRATAGLSDSAGRTATTSPTAREIVWMSERDGWSHLYLYDGATGRVKNQITKGDWVGARRRSRGRGEAADLVPRQRHGRRARIRTSSTTAASTSTAPA